MNKMNRVIVALDVDSKERAIEIVKQCRPDISYFKIGKQLFTAEGPQLVREIKSLGVKVFLDLKFHDIPNTVANAVIESAKLGVDMVNIHLSGGSEMVRKTAEKLNEHFDKNGTKPLLIGVTILTSLDDNALKEIGYAFNTKEMVKRLALIGKNNGADGVVCSPLEIEIVKQSCGKDFITVTPGIRPEFALKKDDQKRVMTPKMAFEKGTDYIVIGRPITKAESIKEAVKKLANELK